MTPFVDLSTNTVRTHVSDGTSPLKRESASSGGQSNLPGFKVLQHLIVVLVKPMPSCGGSAERGVERKFLSSAASPHRDGDCKATLPFNVR